VWRKKFKNVVYFSILVIPLLILFFHPRNFKAAALLDTMVRPVGLFQTPIFELKKLFYYREIYDEYAHVKRQNDVLKAELISIKENEQKTRRYEKIQSFRSNQNYASVVAGVIGRDPSNWNASLIIDKGSAEGLVVGQSVISTLGVVGRIFEVGRNTAKVILLSDPAFAVAAVIERSRENGLLTGTLEGVCHLQYLTANADVKVGDWVVTSRLSTAFPEGVLIGQITDVQASSNSHTVECLVEPAVDLSQLEEVIVVKGK